MKNLLMTALVTVVMAASLAVALALSGPAATATAQDLGDGQPKGGKQPADGEKQPVPESDTKNPPHSATPGQVLPMHADLAKYVGRWQVEGAKQHTGREAVISWQWAAGKGGVMIDLFFPTADGGAPESATHGLLAYHPGTGRIEATSIGGNGDYLKGSVFCDGNRHEWTWDTWTVANGGKAGHYRQVFTFADDGKSYHCIAYSRSGLEWVKAFESKFKKIEEK